MLLSLDDDLRANNLKYQLISFGDTGDQRILQSDWTKEITSHTQPKVIALHATFP